jgi:uncharacterized membrane protein
MKNNLNYGESVEKIVNNYLHRLKSHLKGLPAKDQEELTREIQSHIYESYTHNPTEDEIERIFEVLDKLGEPAEVVSSRMSESMVTIGKKRKRPLYIAAGVLIGIFGLPLGLGGVAVIIGLLAVVGALLLAYFITTFSFVIAGWIGFVASLLQIFRPDILPDYIHIYNGVITDPQLAGVAGAISSIVLTAAGLGLLFLGKRMLEGIGYLGNLTLESIRSRKHKIKARTTV